MTTLVIQPDATAGLDTYLDSAAPTTNNATLIHNHTAGASGHSLIKFDLSSIPSDAIIIDATLTLVCTSVGSAVADTVHLRKSLVSWVENQATWNIRATATNWAAAGGLSGTDYDSTPSAGTSVTSTGTYTWDLTTDVRDFVDGTLTNNGWWITNNGAILKTFASSDNSIAANRPKLTIEYVVPSGSSIQPGPAEGKDTFIYQGNTSANFGAHTDLVSGRITGNMASSLIRIDVAPIPAGVTILSAVLSIWCYAEADTANTNHTVHRMLVEWYEGIKTGSTPSGEDGSTYNLRNHNGSVAWAGGAGVGSGSDYTATATDTATISSIGTWINWTVTADVQDFVDGSATNYGWFLKTVSPNNSKSFYASDYTTDITKRPKLTVTYWSPMQGVVAGTSSVTGALSAKGNLQVTIAGTSLAEATAKTNFFSFGTSDGVATVSGTIFASGYIAGNSFGDVTVVADIKASYHSAGEAAGTSSHVAHLKGRFYLGGVAGGTVVATATPSLEGQMRGSTAGTSLAIAIGYARATGKATVVGCNPVPLFYLTDGTIKPNGQQNLLNFLSERNGYLLRNYRPQIPQYKEGGRFSNSSQSQGRRLRFRVFDNAIDVMELAVKASDQDELIQFQQDLIAFQEAAADYWVSDYTLLPIYLVGRAARETYTKYAIVHMISVPELENPYAQPFFSNHGATFENLTVRIEHGMWMSTPPGFFDCVEISSQREWTVSGWQ